MSLEGVERGVKGSELKRPIQRRPARMGFFSSVSLKVVLLDVAQVRSSSEDDEELRTLVVASFQGKGLSAKSSRKS